MLTEASRQANFTNEGGVDGRIRYLRNVMGLWLLQESLRTWEREAHRRPAGAALAAGELPPGGPVIDPDDPRSCRPATCRPGSPPPARARPAAPPATRAALVRCILDSLAAAYGRTVREAAAAVRQHGRRRPPRRRRRPQRAALPADRRRLRLPVVAGPVEATALGNVLVQARARGLLAGDLAALRALVRATQDMRRYEPRTRPRDAATVRRRADRA